MRPSHLNPLFSEVRSINSIGPRIAELLKKLAGEHLIDLIFHRPSGAIDRRARPLVSRAESNKVATLQVQVDRHIPPEKKNHPYKVRCKDDSGSIDLVFFRGGKWLERQMPTGNWIVISGEVTHFNGMPQMSHPDHISPIASVNDIASLETVYPLTGGLVPKVLQKAINHSLERVPDLPEWIEPELVAQQKWPSWKEAILKLHQPESLEDLEPASAIRRRLGYDELFQNQMALALVRHVQRTQQGLSREGDGRLRERVRSVLPFKLTGSQTSALADIYRDMAAPTRMLRLVQGDVGSGKTMVALFAMLNAVETGAQAALMAPTEILARQHFEGLEPLAKAAGLSIGVLTGRDKGKARQAVLGGLADGSLPLVIGTHALFQEDVVFRDLGLAVIDEQHRFGVHQRMQLSAKGRAVDLLVMTATPIPRTLTLTSYGDMDVSLLTEKPPGRKPIDTKSISSDRLGEIIAGVKRKIDEGAQVYWVCPLVEENEKLDLAAASDRHADLTAHLGEVVGLVHGKMSSTEKDEVMMRFAQGQLRVLVATTVIEVGVNVPNATVIIIEHAERFGLAQLHQLRGRVGRGDKKSSCLLLYTKPLGDVARSRIETMRETEDGFRIAEEDLRLRGPGEVLGTRQSGLPEFKLADIEQHADLLPVARKDAERLLSADPTLTSPRGLATRQLMHLFKSDGAFRYLSS